MMELPSAAELEAAAGVVYRHMPPTPQYRWPVLCDEIGADLWLKHENHTPVGAFKLRGGLVYFDRLGKVPGVIAATRGNHGQSVAYCAREYGLPATIVVPHGNSVEKNAAMRALGARLIEHGHDFQAAFEQAQALAQDELLRAVPDLHALYVPIGLGSGICAAIAARNALGLRTEIVGIGSAHARAYAVSFAKRRPVELPVTARLADGMAVRKPDSAALEVVWHYVDRIVGVSDDE